MYLEYLGMSLAVVGSILAVIGALINNLWHKHITAMEIWMVSNILLLVWSGGYLAGWWNGGVSILALFCSYAVYASSNYWGLTHPKCDPLEPRNI